MNTKIIGLCGFAGVGKDTAAANMHAWTRMAFADELKKDLKPFLNWIGCDLTDPKHKEAARDLMVAWGKTARKFRPDFWVARLFNQINPVSFMPTQIVITDVRYLNEAFEILRRGGNVVRISRTGYGPRNAEEAGSIAEIECHVGEGKWSIPVVMNDSTPEELAKKVLEAAE